MPDNYRFTLQWGNDTVEKVQAGELLKRMGNRKSGFIVEAVSEYINMHPETVFLRRELKLIVKPSFTKEQIRSLIMSIIDEKMAGIAPAAQENRALIHECPVGDAEIDVMMENLDMF